MDIASALEIIYTSPESSCDCDRCKSMCCRPCWPLPEDAEKLIDAGYANRLVLDMYCLKDRNIDILAPANPGFEGKNAPGRTVTPAEFAQQNLVEAIATMAQFVEDMALLKSGCTFHNKQGLCELHDKGLKPTEGRRTHHSVDNDTIHEAVAMAWDGDYGHQVIAKWKKLTNNQ